MLSIDEIAQLLEKKGCYKSHTLVHGHEYCHPSLDQPLYINRDAGVSPSGLVIHTNYLSRRDSLKAIPGVESRKADLFGSSFRKYPEKINNGVKPQHYGIPFGFHDEMAFNSFFEKLMVDKLDDIAEAEAKGEFADLTVTEKMVLISARRGQGKYRDDLIELWGHCSVTECVGTTYLKASHIRPWRDSSNIERLDVFNGLLLIPNLDMAFDRGFITFEDDGVIRISSLLSLDAQDKLGINGDLKILNIHKENIKYLEFHRANIFEKELMGSA